MSRPPSTPPARLNKELEQTLLRFPKEKLKIVTGFVKILEETELHEQGPTFLTFHREDREEKNIILVLNCQESIYLNIKKQIEILRKEKKKENAPSERKMEKGEVHTKTNQEGDESGSSSSEESEEDSTLENNDKNNVPLETTLPKRRKRTKQGGRVNTPQTSSSKTTNSLVEKEMNPSMEENSTTQLKKKRSTPSADTSVFVEYSKASPPESCENLAYYYVSNELIKKNAEYGFKEMLPVFSCQIKDLEEHYKIEMKEIQEESLHILELSKEIGKGLFASQNLSKGNYLFYFGEVVDKISKTKVFMSFGEDLFVDCSRYRSKAYYINHGCEPNCIFEEVMVNGVPHIVVILIKDVIEGEELLVDYGWISGEGEGKKPATLCRCSSKQCRMFLEKDHCEKLEKLLKGFKRIDQSQIELKDFQFPLEIHQGFTSMIIVERIKSLGILGNASRIGDAMESLLICQYFENHDVYCDAPKRKGRGNKNGCGHCNLKLYRAYNGQKELDDKDAARMWILNRKKRGQFLTLLHSDLSKSLKFYYDDHNTSFIEVLNQLPSLEIFEDSMTKQKIQNLRGVHIK